MNRNRSRRARRAEVSGGAIFEELKSWFLSDPDRSSPKFMDDSDLVEHFVEKGWLTPEDAETEASSRKWEPFETRPRAQEFEPGIELFWTLPMATAWIASRDLAVVRDLMPEVAKHTRAWVRFGEGYRLEQAETPTLNDVAMLLELVGDDRFPATLGELRKALRQGELTCWAIEESRRVDLDSMDWIDLDFDSGSGTHLFSGRLDRRLQDPRVESKRLLEIWPPADVEPRPASSDSLLWIGSPKATGKVLSALTALQEVFPNGLPPGLAATVRNRRVVEWMQAHHQTTASDRTIAEAVKLYRARK
ncbi:hypothetical protein [Bosea sp. UNC402CLCol]|uniref:hypothetical protein n=1 Tax=Bosea sp. UNC402CLCol TaxID=1510531 RepID=UPI000570A0EF|nr:hypothetical protein [Bosea sp. UNC402CLCol]